MIKVDTDMPKGCESCFACTYAGNGKFRCNINKSLNVYNEKGRLLDFIQENCPLSPITELENK